jgi:hypothetical protein
LWAAATRRSELAFVECLALCFSCIVSYKSCSHSRDTLTKLKCQSTWDQQQLAGFETTEDPCSSLNCRVAVFLLSDRVALAADDTYPFYREENWSSWDSLLMSGSAGTKARSPHIQVLLVFCLPPICLYEWRSRWLDLNLSPVQAELTTSSAGSFYLCQAHLASCFLETSPIQELMRLPQPSLLMQPTLFFRLENSKVAGLKAPFLSMLIIR